MCDKSVLMQGTEATIAVIDRMKSKPPFSKFRLLLGLACVLAGESRLRALAQGNTPPIPAAAPNDANAPAKNAPRIEFETNLFDFGKITAVETLSGTFKFKNVGDAVLKVDPPQASCECTEPKVTPNVLAPGESGEVSFTIKLDRPLNGQRMIMVHSNDPKTPNVHLTLQLDYTPLYEFSPKRLTMMLPPGKDEVQSQIVVGRKDGKPLGVDRISASREWITATFEPASSPLESSARINVTVHRPSGSPGPIDAAIQLWSSQVPQPLQSLPVTGEVLGELAANPRSLYWVIPDLGKDKSAYPDEALTRKIELKSVLGREIELKKITSTIKGLNTKVVPKVPGRTFELILKFEELPKEFANGKVTIETSLASLPEIEVPMTVAVP
jgi:hypothetical protein